MSINYGLAEEYADEVRALFMGESEEREWPPLGDGGRAFGPGQMHPAFFAENYGRAHRFPRAVGDTLADAQVKAAAAYLDFNSAMLGSLDAAVQAYQEGVQDYINGARNPEYLQRFRNNLARIRGGAR